MGRLALLTLLFVFLVSCRETFAFIQTCRNHQSSRRLNTLQLSSNSEESPKEIVKRATSTFETTFASNRQVQNPRIKKLTNVISRSRVTSKPPNTSYKIAYDYDELIIGDTDSANTTAVMLVHPIGVGIGRWYYDRLMKSLADADLQQGRIVFLSPDLLGSYTASSPMSVDSGKQLKKFPLLNITDWAEQLESLMREYEIESHNDGYKINNWSIVANGGCAPIALKVAQSAVDKSAPFEKDLTNVVISSPPRLSFFLEGSDPKRVQKSYRTLSGIVGNLFWRYSLRKDGKFIQTFSERNLVGDPDRLGKHWTPNCVSAARHQGGKSKYSTFAFLAGALQDGCQASLDSLKGKNVQIDFIRGTERKRRRRPKSFFWKRKKTSNKSADTEMNVIEETVEEYMQRNGNRGSVSLIGGRISLAWEDSGGYAKELIKLLLLKE